MTAASWWRGLLRWRCFQFCLELCKPVGGVGEHVGAQARDDAGELRVRPSGGRVCDRHDRLEATSERSAALYERLGFKHIREMRVGSAPPLWLMRRPSRSHAEEPNAAQV